CEFPGGDADAADGYAQTLVERRVDGVMADLLRAWPDALPLDFHPDAYVALLAEVRALAEAAPDPAPVERSAAIALGLVRHAFAPEHARRGALAPTRGPLPAPLAALRGAPEPTPPDGDFLAWARVQAARMLAPDPRLDGTEQEVARLTAQLAELVRPRDRY